MRSRVTTGYFSVRDVDERCGRAIAASYQGSTTLTAASISADVGDGRNPRWHSVGTFRRFLTGNGGSRRSRAGTSLHCANGSSSQLSDHDPRQTC